MTAFASERPFRAEPILPVLMVNPIGAANPTIVAAWSPLRDRCVELWAQWLNATHGHPQTCDCPQESWFASVMAAAIVFDLLAAPAWNVRDLDQLAEFHPAASELSEFRDAVAPIEAQLRYVLQEARQPLVPVR